ncbi:MAG: Ig-like domain-containing protein [Lachnospiraceae bacterium]|nr:Ig-like domain-containing protein [Lachnospiraceae bacterium]
MNKNKRRLMALLLALAMILSLGSPAAKAEKGSGDAAEQTTESGQPVTVNDLDPASLKVQKLGSFSSRADYAAQSSEISFSPNDVVRASIFLDAKSTADAGYSIESINSDPGAIAYRQALETGQHNMEAQIEATTGRPLDVKWNLTLLVNAISADVRYGDIPKILTINGVESVELETLYLAPEPVQQPATPQTSISTDSMTYANQAWAAGYSGVGSRIAILDTGIDVDHISFDEDAFMYSINQQGAAEKLMTAADIPSTGLNKKGIYLNPKIPFAFNYGNADGDTTNLGHLQPDVGNHGSHVAGIAAGNRYIPKDGDFVDAAEEVGAVGVAPDAQIILMKVFDGKGAYTGGYMAAIEDAIVLGCDACNLSLGTSAQGFTWTTNYQKVLNKLANASENQKMVVTISAGNQSSLVNSMATDMYIDDIYLDTIGSPGSYLNALTVANADNIGRTYVPLNFDGAVSAPYVESATKNGGMVAMAGTHEYVYIDSIGSAEDYAAADAAIGLNGKIVMVNRGSLDFEKKANNAIPYSPKALIIANTARGTMSMALGSYAGDFTVLSIAKASAQAIKAEAASQTVPVGDKSVTCYTGTLTVKAGTAAREDALMVSSSSWGGPGSLILKPEITAPGGSINAAEGYDPEDKVFAGGESHSLFGLKTGTSMAAPHVAGLAALVGQYQRENPMADRNEALSAYPTRAIIQSLMMSTATPMKNDGLYLSLLNQGAGLIDAQKAVESKSVVMIGDDAYLTAKTKSNQDGKVKVELGDDPARSGSYSFTATLFNTASETLHFNTDLKLFTQARYTSEGQTFMDLLTRNLSGYGVSYSWEYIPPAGFENHDVNKDGKTDPDDAQAILDYLTGEISQDEWVSDYNAFAGEMDGEEGISSYDAHLLLKHLDDITEYTDGMIPAGGKRSVTVTLTLPDSLKAQLLAEYPSGNYLEGFLYFTCDSENSEGVAYTDEHSVPILGFLGNWTDPSMFNNTSYTDVLYGTDQRIPYSGNKSVEGDIAGKKNTNYLTVNYGDGVKKFSGNPYMVEEIFPADRLALNSKTVLESFTYSLLRSAGTMGWAVSKIPARGGNIQQVLGAARTATLQTGLYVDNGTFKNTDAASKAISTAVGSYSLNEGDFLRVGFYALPELTGLKLAMNQGWDISGTNYGYIREDGNFKIVLADAEMQQWIGKGAWIGYDFVLDDTAPVLDTPTLEENILHLSITDNQNIAYVALMSLDGVTKYLEVAPGSASFEEDVDISGFADDVKGFVAIFIADYAGNEVAKAIQINDAVSEDPYKASSVDVTPEEVTLLVGGEMDLSYEMKPMTVEDTSVTWESSNSDAVTVDENGHIKAVGIGSAVIKATANNNEEVFGSCQVTVKEVDRILKGIAKHTDGTAYFVSFNVNDPDTLTRLSETDQSSYNLRSALIDENGTLFMGSMQNDRSTLYVVDQDDYSLSAPVPTKSGFGANGIARGLSNADTYGSLVYVYGSGVYGANLYPWGTYTTIGNSAFSGSISGGYGVGVACKDAGPTEASYYVIDSNGVLWETKVVLSGTRSFGSLLKVMDTTYESPYSSADGTVYHGQALYYDGEFLYWSHTMQDKSKATLFAIDTVNGILYELGDFAVDVQAVVALYEDGIAAPADKVVSSVTVEPKTLTLEVEQTETLTATVVHTGAANTAVTWSSSDETVATVENGVVTAVAPGTAIISAISVANSKAVGRCELRVIASGQDPNAVTALRLNAETANLLVGAEVSLVATVEPDEAEDKSVTWSSSNPDVVSVDANGKLTALAAGTATITAKSNANEEISASCAVTVKAASQGFRAIVRSDEGTYFSYFNLEDLNQVTKLHADSKADMSLRSAFVAEDGNLYAGTMHKVTNAENKLIDATTIYLVDQDSYELSLYYPSVNAANGLARGLSGGDAYGSLVRIYGGSISGGNFAPIGTGTTVGANYFSVSNPVLNTYFVGVALKETGPSKASYFAVDHAGNIWQANIIKAGTRSFEQPLTKVVSTGITVDLAGLAYAGPYHSQALYFDGELLYWAHGLTNGSVELIVIDPASGLFYTLGTFAEGIHAVMGIYTHGDVAPPAPADPVPVTSVSVSPETLTLEVTEQSTLTATVLPEDADNKSVSWTSSDPAVATVDENGLVTAQAAGTAVITAASVENPELSDSCTVTVNAPVAPIPVTSVTLNLDAVTLLPGGTVTLTAEALPEQADNRTVLWSSSDETVATVENGVVTALAAGTAVITAASVSNPEVMASCTITVKAADLALGAIVTNDVGTFFSEFNVGDLSVVTAKHDDSKGNLQLLLRSAFVSEDGTLYAGTRNGGGSNGKLYKVDPVSFELTDHATMTYGMANDLAPGLTNKDPYGSFAYAYYYYVLGGALEEYTFPSGTVVPAGKYYFTVQHTENPQKYFIGLACSETSANKASYYVLDNNGTIWQTSIVLSGTRSFTTPVKVVETGMTVSTSSAAYYSQTLYYYDGLLYWAHGLTNNTVEMVVIDPVSGVFNILGTFPSDVHAVMGLYEPAKISGATGNEAAGPEAKLPGELIGSLTSVQVVDKAAERDKEEATVQAVTPVASTGYDITESTDVTNGMLKVTYDTDNTSLLKAESQLEYHSLHVNEEQGIIIFAYANEASLGAGEALLTLEFSQCNASVVMVETVERSEKLDVQNEEVTIPLEAEDHDYGEPTYEWVEKEGGGYTVTAKMVCQNDENHVIEETVEAVYAVDSNPDGLKAGKGIYTASFSGTHAEFVTQRKEVEIPTEVMVTATVTMKENFDLNLYFRNVEETDAGRYTVKWTFDGDLEDPTREHQQNLGELTRLGDGRYKITLAEVFSFQMTHLFHIIVEQDGEEVVSLDYSVQKYLENRLNSNEEESFKAVYRAALNYGTAAQYYFDGKQFVMNDTKQDYDVNLANHVTNEKLDETDKVVTAEKPTNAMAAAGSVEGLSLQSVALIFGSEMSIKLYFRYSGNISELSFSADKEKTVTDPVLEKDGRYYVKLKGISSFELYKDYTITIAKGEESSTLTYSPYTYAARNWAASDQLTSDICQALVAFGEAARLCWPTE